MGFEADWEGWRIIVFHNSGNEESDELRRGGWRRVRFLGASHVWGSLC